MLAQTIRRIDNPSGEFWGGLAAMLVALPSAIAFGVTIFSPLGGSFAAQGALAGILSAFARLREARHKASPHQRRAAVSGGLLCRRGRRLQ